MRRLRSVGVEAHTCDLVGLHGGPHHCADCGSYWLVRVGVVDQAVRRVNR